MRKYLLLTILFPMLLCGCERDLPLESVVEIECTAEPYDTYHQKLSERNMDEFIFEGGCYVLENGTYTNYYGEITDEKIKVQLWEIICAQEKMDTYQGGSGGGTNLVLTDKITQEKFYIGYSIWHQSPEVEGGPVCFVISGPSCGTAYYYPIDEGEDRVSTASEQFDALLTEGVKREENIIASQNE